MFGFDDLLISTVSGLVGSIANAVMTYKTKKLELEEKKLSNQHELAMEVAMRETSIAEANAEIMKISEEYEGKTNVEEVRGKAQALKDATKELFHDNWMKFLMERTGKSIYFTAPIGVMIMLLFALMDIWVKAIRPAATSMFLVVWWYIIVEVYGPGLSAGVVGMSAAEINTAIDMKMMIFKAFVYFSVTIISFWFFDRQLQKLTIKSLEKNS